MPDVGWLSGGRGGRSGGGCTVEAAPRDRLFDAGHHRKTDALDAQSIALVAVRTTGLRVVRADGQLEALRVLADPRDELTRLRVQTVNRLQRLSELIPKQGRGISALQAKAMLATVRPRDLAGKNRRRLAADELGDLIAWQSQNAPILAAALCVRPTSSKHSADTTGRAEKASIRD